jgi:hypothetical protein
MCLRPGLQRLPERIASTEGLGLAAEGRVFKERRKRGRSSTMLPCLARAGFVREPTRAANACDEIPSAKRHGRTDSWPRPAKVGAGDDGSRRATGRCSNRLDCGTGFRVRGTRGLTFELTPTAEAGAVSLVRDDAPCAADQAYSACRSGSGVERGVRPRCSRSVRRTVLAHGTY